MIEQVCILAGMGEGDSVQSDRGAGRWLPLIYPELRRKAQAFLKDERSGHTLSATALVHEAYIKLAGSEDPPDFEKTGHFFASAAEAMRRILIDHARAHQADKRGGNAKRESAELLEHVAQLTHLPSSEDILALDQAFSRLEEQDPKAAEIVRLRFYAGLSVEETARALKLSPRTVKREWQFARAWLYRQMR